MRPVATLAAALLAGALLAGSSAAEPVMFAHFVDVGQGDATLLEFPCGAILIDAGGQDSLHAEALVEYLERFFDRRPDLDRTLESIIVTHNHIDHTRALRRIVESFTVRRYIGTGQDRGRGAEGPNRIRAAADSLGIRVRTVLQRDVEAAGDRAGLTDADIDPLACAACDPQITVLSGRYAENPGWPRDAFRNGNNQSLVVRVDFGESSFLFTGDLEEPAIETLLAFYGESSGEPGPGGTGGTTGSGEAVRAPGTERAGEGPLDVDVYQVGHHGSSNGTTPALLDAMTPEIAVISVGRWDSGRGADDFYNTWHYGHPRLSVVRMLGGAIRGRRSSTVKAMAALRPRTFRETRVRKKIYATAWDGTVRVRATLDERFRVKRSP